MVRETDTRGLDCNRTIHESREREREEGGLIWYKGPDTLPGIVKAMVARERPRDPQPGQVVQVQFHEKPVPPPRPPQEVVEILRSQREAAARRHLAQARNQVRRDQERDQEWHDWKRQQIEKVLVLVLVVEALLAIFLFC